MSVARLKLSVLPDLHYFLVENISYTYAEGCIRVFVFMFRIGGKSYIVKLSYSQMPCRIFMIFYMADRYT